MNKNEIIVIYGSDIKAMAIRLAKEANLASLIGDRNKRVGLKPNLVDAKPPSGGATTHVEIAAGLIAYLKENGFNNLVILEGAWKGGSTTDAFRVCGYDKLAKETGVALIDTKRDKARVCDCKGLKLEICESALALDFMINLPVIKGHCQTRLSCALKNSKGIIPDREKGRYHTLGLTKPIAHLNTMVRNDFIVADGICGDPDFELGGNPVYVGRLAAARDPVLCDAWAADQLGIALNAVPYISLAEKLGVGSADLSKAKIRVLKSIPDQTPNKVNSASPSSKASVTVKPSGIAARLAPYINAIDACSSCYASLIFALSRLDRAKLDRLKEKICIGQGFKGMQAPEHQPNTQDALGVGQCCAGFAHYCPGCPPSGSEVLRFLKERLGLKLIPVKSLRLCSSIM